MTQNNIEAVGVTIKKVPSFILEVELNYYILIVEFFLHSRLIISQYLGSNVTMYDNDYIRMRLKVCVKSLHCECIVTKFFGLNNIVPII